MARAGLKEACLFGAAALGPLALYVATLPRTVVLEDDGLFLMAGASLGVAHPPGYPLYTLVLHLFMRLPFGTPAFTGHLSSAVLGALACAMVAACARRFGASRGAALAGAWLFGASEHFWSQAIIAEVYTLNALLFFGIYALVLRGAPGPDAVAGSSAPPASPGTAAPEPARGRGGRRMHRGRRAYPTAASPASPETASRRSEDSDPGAGGFAGWGWIAAAAVYGLGLANHWPLMVLATPGLVVAALPGWRALRTRLAPCAGVAVASAALPYAWMVWRSRQEPWFNFHGPLESMGEVWHYISRRSYAGVDTSVSADWSDQLRYLLWFGNETLWQLTLPGFVLAAIGLFALLRRGPPAEGAGRNHRRRGIGLAAAGGGLVWLGNGVALIGLLGFDFDTFTVSVFRPYSLVCYGLAAVWLAVGLQFVLDATARWMRGRPAHEPGRWWKPAAAVLAGAAMAAVSVHAHAPFNNRSGSDFASLYARMVFDTLPPAAVLFTGADADTAPLGYFRFVEGRRPDVTLFNTQGLVFGRRLFDWRTPETERRAAIHAFALESEPPVFSTAEMKPSPGLGIRYHGFLSEFVPGEGAIELRFDPRQTRLFGELLGHASGDTWERNRRAQLISSFGKYLGLAVLTGDAHLLEQLGPSLAQAEGNFFSLVGMADSLMEYGDAAHHARVEGWLTAADSLAGEVEYPRPLARLAYLKGFLRHRLGDAAAARALFEESTRIHPHPDNASFDALEQLRSAGEG